MLDPNKKISSSPSLRHNIKNSNSLANFFGTVFLKKQNISITEENKNESSRVMMEKKLPFSLKDHFKEEDLPHFGNSDIKTTPNSKSQPDFYLNKSFQFTTTTKTQGNDNDRTPIDDKSMLDQSLNSCLICFDKKPNAVFMDCGHGG